MKKILFTGAVMAIVIAMPLAVFAASQSVGVTASVQSKCTNGADGSFNAFNIDPDSAQIDLTTDADGTSPTVKCTKGAAVAITCSPALGATGVLTMAGDTPAGDITYEVTACPSIASAAGFGSPDAIDIGIRILANAAAASAAGNHTGTITVTTAF